MKKESWIVVANSAHARLFKLNKLELIEMDGLIHPASRLREIELTGDKPGETNESWGPGRHPHPMAQQTPPKKVEAINFARQIAEHLNSARSRGEIEKLYLAASPSFLGLLRQEMDPKTLGLVVAELDKDITTLKPKEIINYFPIGL